MKQKKSRKVNLFYILEYPSEHCYETTIVFILNRPKFEEID